MSVLRTCKDCQTCFWTTRRLQQCCEECLAVRKRQSSDRVLVQIRSSATENNAGKKKTERDCLRCKKKFMSWGIKNRLCTPCGTMGSSPYEN
jgi:hypothetical protein